ncbi:uncharacterized protein simc1 [Eucyclogobius newberryi]|uniref:uncharacterized protein simc1 n=1 Tax=Eucyclogobius newberryi TaxID=166745 RepID=UPI003B5AA23E
MAVVITLSSDSDSDSELEVVGYYSNKNAMLPLSSVRVDVSALDVKTPLSNCDLTNPRLAPVELNIFSRFTPTSAVVDLTENESRCKDQEELLNVPSGDSQLVKTDYKSLECPGNLRISLERNQDCVERRQKTQLTTSVVLKRLSILEKNYSELLTSDKVSVIKSGETMSLHFKRCDGNDPRDSSNTTTPHGLQPSMEMPRSISCQEQVTGFHRNSSVAQRSQADHLQQEHQLSQPTLTQSTEELSSIPSPAYASASNKGQSGLSNELRASSPSLPVGTLTLQPVFSRSNCSPACPSAFPCCDVNDLMKTRPICESLNMTELLKSQYDEVTFDKESVRRSPSPESVLSVSRTIYSDTFGDNIEENSPVSFSWEESRDDEMADFELGLNMDCTSPSEDDKYYVCPAAVKRLMHCGGDDLRAGESPPQMLNQRSLSMVYSTMQESYPEGTLELLSDLLQPGFYLPKEITLHLLEDILLNPQSPHHNSLQAFRLLMKTQRHHIVDDESVSWNWEMLNSVMEKKELRPESVCMFLEYAVQTLEDDFKTKQSTSELYLSIAKALLSFDRQFPHIRDICKWLFSAIEKSTDGSDVKGDHTRRVVVFQKMLSLALEVDCSPVINSVKLSQEFFHMLVSNVPLRPQRMLLLESLQSRQLRCKLLQHLLDYFCPVKTSMPMSLSLMLHFLKNCTLPLDPIDGTDKWRRWEELIHHLWMFLLSYSNTMKQCFSGSRTEQTIKVGSWIYKPEDMVSKCAVREAVEAFLSRSQDDIGEALPLHVEESLTYLQDHLMDVCQC